MKKVIQYVLAVLVLGSGAAAFFIATTMIWIVFAVVLVICSLFCCAGSIKKGFQKRAFWSRRHLAKEAVDRLQGAIHFYEHDDVFGLKDSANSGGDFAIALDNAKLFAEDMNEWILMIIGYFNRGCLPNKGLQIEQVVEVVDAVQTELIACYHWLKEERKGRRPAMLAADWYNLESVFPGFRELYGTNFRPWQSQSRPLLIVACSAVKQPEPVAQLISASDHGNGAHWRPFYRLGYWIAKSLWLFQRVLAVAGIRRRKTEDVRLLTHQPQRYPGTELLHDARLQRDPQQRSDHAEEVGGASVTVLATWRELKKQKKPRG